MTFILSLRRLEYVAGLALGVVYNENDAGLKSLSTWHAPAALPYLANNLLLGLAASSTATTSINLRYAMKVICTLTAVKHAWLIHVRNAPYLAAKDG